MDRPVSRISLEEIKFSPYKKGLILPCTFNFPSVTYASLILCPNFACCLNDRALDSYFLVVVYYSS
jgi:hypothetical protein